MATLKYQGFWKKVNDDREYVADFDGIIYSKKNLNSLVFYVEECLKKGITPYCVVGIPKDVKSGDAKR